MPMIDVLAEVAIERAKQDEKWGEQNHPDGTSDSWVRRVYAEIAKRYCQSAARRGECTWRLILDEEVNEAFAESAPDNLRKELLQVAAVAVAWVEAIDRRGPPTTPTEARVSECKESDQCNGET